MAGKGNSWAGGRNSSKGERTMPVGLVKGLRMVALAAVLVAVLYGAIALISSLFGFMLY